MDLRRLAGWTLPLLLGAALSAADRDTRLIEAVKAARRSEAEGLLRQRVDVNLADVDGTTPLHWAAYRGDVEMAELLLSAGASPALVNRYGVTPLALACAAGQASLVERLLAAGADANATSPDGETALMTAARTGRTDVVSLLLGRGADPNARESWRRQTALMWAASGGHVGVLNALIAHGADVKARSGAEQVAPSPTPTALAARATGTGGRIGGGAGLTSFLFAVRGGRIDATRALLDAGADVNDRTPDGTTALMLAIFNAHFELAVSLLDRGADVTLDAAGVTALHLALQVRNPDWDRFPDPRPSGTRSSLEIIEALVAHGADPNAKTSRRVQGITGVTPLMLAAKAGDTEAMQLLVSRGAEPTLAANDGTTALMAAAGLTFTEGKTRTTGEEAVAAVRLALELGVDVNAVNAAGDTALHGAAGRGANEVVKLLVERGARIDAKNGKGLTALDVTETVAEGKTVHADTAQLLRELASAR